MTPSPNPQSVLPFLLGKHAPAIWTLPALLIGVIGLQLGWTTYQDYQNTLADALMRGIESYFSKNPPLARNRSV